MKPQVIAHRGWSHSYPENTGAAFDAALTLPVDGMELDLQLTRDEQVVIYHDRNLSKLGLPAKTVSQLTLKELQSLDAGAWFDEKFRNERLLSLDELLQRYAKKTTLCLEIKARGGRENWKQHQTLVKKALECVRKNRVASRVFFLCFHENILCETLKQDPRLRCVWNIEKAPTLDAAFLRRGAPFFALCFDVKILTPSLVKTLQKKNKKVFTYTCNSKSALKTALHCGVDAILSDKPDWILENLK